MKKTAATHYHLPAEITDQHIAILGKTGSGKTFTAKGYVEQLIGKQRRCCILDPTGVWWGLRYTPAKKPGLRVPIIGGQYGDIGDAEPEACAEYVAARDAANPAVILDLSEQLIGERHRFAEVFFRTLYQVNRRPLHLIIDEADEVAPQNPLQETKRMLHQVDRIVRRGRTRGFIVTMISQRPAVLHKNVLSQANTLIAMQLTASQDRDAVKAWIKGQADMDTGARVLADLPKLQTGEGYVWAPQSGILTRVRFPVITTLDSSVAPKHGEEAVTPPEPPSYAGEFTDLPALAALPDPTLKPKHRGRGAVPTPARPAIDVDAIKKIEDEAFARGRAAGLEEGRREGVELGRKAVLHDFTMPLAELQAKLGRWQQEPPTDVKVETIPPDELRPALTKRDAGRVNSSAWRGWTASQPEIELPDSTLRVLSVLALRYPAKFTVGEWAALAGLVARGGAWGKHYRTLKAAGLITEENGEVQATPVAVAALPRDVQVTASTREELIDLWQGKLGGQTRALLEALLEAGDRGLYREQMAAILGMAERGGAFLKLIRGLVRNQLAEQRGDIYFAGSVLDV